MSMSDGTTNDRDTQALTSIGLLASNSEAIGHPTYYTPLAILRTGTQYWDYSDITAIARDAEEMRNFQNEGAPRDLYRDEPLQAKPFEISQAAASMLELAHLVLDSRKKDRFHHELVDKKIVPSLGGRHGINAYLAGTSGNQWLLSLRSDGSHFPTHSWCEVAPEGPQSERLILCANFERYQWRYRNGWVYQCVYFDLGHVLATLALCARQAGLELAIEHASNDMMGLERELVNEPILTVRSRRGQDSIQ